MEERGEDSLMTVVQKNHHLQAIVEDGDQPSGVVFFLGDGQEGGESRSHEIQTPVEVHHSVVMELLDDEAASVGEQSGVTSETTAQQTAGHQASDGPMSPEEAKLEEVGLEEEDDLGSSHSGGFYQRESVEVNHAAGSQQAVEDVGCEVAENQGLVSSPENIRNEENQAEPEDEEGTTSKSRETPAHGSVILGEKDDLPIAPQVEGRDDTDVQAEQGGDLGGVRGESDDEGGSLHSSNESIMKVTDEESVCDEAEESLRDELGFEKSPSTEETLWSEGPNILDLHINGYPEEPDGDAADGAELSGSLDANSAVKAADLTENSDFSILEASGSPALADQKYLEEDEPLPGDCAEVEAC